MNLPKDKADEYRAQARRLRERLEGYLGEHPGLHAEENVAVRQPREGHGAAHAQRYRCRLLHQRRRRARRCAEAARTTWPSGCARRSRISARIRSSRNTYSVTVSFKGTGLDVDVVPILYNGDPNWYGNLVSQEDGSFLATCIPRHLEFIRKRKQAHETDFAQVARLMKFWARKMKREQDGFRFKSFMIELVLAHLADQGLDFSDYPEALQHFFTYIARSNIRELSSSATTTLPSSVGTFTEPVKIIDPVNAKNNVSKLYTAAQADAIVDAALDAGDAIDAALAAPTKQETVRYWQKVFGSAFQV